MGYRVAALEIQSGTSSFIRAAERGIYVTKLTDSATVANIQHQADWDRGYEHCVMAYQMGLDVQDLVRRGAMGFSFKFPDPRKR